jgi:SNF2 family DNA or RNA helicase
MKYELFKPSSKLWKPHAYQKKGIKFLLEHAACALLLDPGLGKTSITLGAIKLLKSKKIINKVLIVAPLRVCHLVWPKELSKWTDFKNLKMVVLHGPNKEELLNQDADIYVINPEGLDWLLGVEKTKVVGRDGRQRTKVSVDLRRFKKHGFDTLVFDELSKFKHINTGRYKAIKQVLGTFRRRWGLTGSPAPNGLIDLFGQCYVLDQGRTLGEYITQYRSKYFLPSHNGFGWNIRKGAEQEIYERISPLVLRMAANDYLEMPLLIENNIMVDLPPKIMEIYQNLEDDLLALLEDKIVTAATSGVASMKCRQVANGGIYLNPEVEALVKLPKSKREWVNLHTEKVDALSDLIEELQGEPLLIAYEFGHDFDRIKTKFGDDIPYIGTGVSTAKSLEIEAAWNKGELPYLFAHPQSIAHGLNLQEVGRHVCWHSMTWDYELYDQFIRRILRQGNKHKKVFCHHILARDTVDQLMLYALRSKAGGQNAFFDALKLLHKNRK